MARGGSKDGNGSPIIGNNGVTATPAELAALSRYALDIFEQEPPDLKDPEAVREAIQHYFMNCEQNGIRPANLGLYASLGLTKQDVSDIIRGANKSKVNPACIDLLKKAKRALSSYREGLAMTGKLNPVTAIFWSKNFDQMSDVQHIEVTAAPGPAASMTPEEIARQIEQDIPIDAEYQLSDNSTDKE